jgi:hypothetical protein
MPASRLEAAKSVSSALPESKHKTVQPIPKTALAARRESGRKLQRQRSVTGTGHIFTKLVLIRRENADATSSARNGHICECAWLEVYQLHKRAANPVISSGCRVIPG